MKFDLAHLRAAVPWVSAAVSGLAQVAVFPRIDWAWLAPVCVIPLLIVLPGRPWKERLLLGWVSGAIFWGGTCYWIYPVMRDYASITPVVAAVLFILFFAIMALHMGAFAALAGPQLTGWRAFLAVPFLWVAIEGNYQYAGFTWMQIGNASLDFPVSHLLRLAPWTGIYGSSLVFLLVNVAIATALIRRSPRPLVALVTLVALVALPPLPDDRPAAQKARLVQPNVHPDLLRTDWPRTQGTAHLERMQAMSTSDPTDGPRPSLVVWPEYPVAAYFYEDAAMRSFLERVARKSGAAFVFNTVTFEDGDRMRPRNSSITLDGAGAVKSLYSKMHLVPFGEFVPWPFHYFVEKVTMQAGRFRPGSEIVVADIGEGRIGTFICYESVFGRSIRRFVADGAELLVNISNDSWYGRSAAREQHLLIARMRAVENARWLLRATNDGVTSAISPSGRVVASLPSYVQDYVDVPFEYRDDRTGYVRFGEWFWWLSVVVSAAFLGMMGAQLRRKR